MATATPNTVASNVSAKAIIDKTLDDAQLGGLGDLVWNAYLTGRITDVNNFDQIRSVIGDTQQYKDRFQAVIQSAKAGHPISEAQQINLEGQYTSLLRQYGIPKGIYDKPSDFTSLIVGQVDSGEFEDRLKHAQSVAVNHASPEVRDELLSYYGVGDGVGAMTAYWLNPNEALPVIDQQVTAAQIGAQAKITKYGQISRDQAEYLGSLGVNSTSANQGFTALASLDEIRTALGNESPNEISGDTLLAAAFAGDAQAQAQINQRKASRVAAFNGNTQFTQSTSGQTGVGTARQA